MLKSIKKLLVRKFFARNNLIKRKIGNNIMYLDINDAGISGQLLDMSLGGEEREPAFMRIVRQELRRGMTAIDISRQ